MTRDQAMTLVKQGVSELNQALAEGRSEILQRYLNMLGRFHRYSFNNAILIAAQRPDATHVAGFHTWKRLGRFVQKGEQGIAILAPMVYRAAATEIDDETADSNRQHALYGFKVVYVFDVSQTGGKDLPEFAGITGEPCDHLDRLEQLVRSRGIELEYEYIGGRADGASLPGKIILRPDLPTAERFAVLVHELAHELLHQQNARKHDTTKTVRETEAEAVAHVVCRASGMECTTRCSDYIQLYRGNTNALSESLDLIQKTAAQIIRQIDPDSRELAA